MKNGFIKGIGINTKEKGYREDFAFCYATYHPAVNNLKQTLMEQCLIESNTKSAFAENHLLEISNDHSYKRGKSLKDTIVRSKI